MNEVDKIIAMYKIPDVVDDLRHKQMDAWWRYKKAQTPTVKIAYRAEFLRLQAMLIELEEV